MQKINTPTYTCIYADICAERHTHIKHIPDTKTCHVRAQDSRYMHKDTRWHTHTATCPQHTRTQAHMLTGISHLSMLEDPSLWDLALGGPFEGCRLLGYAG